jgi:phosphoglycolate phosphatase
MLGIAFGVSPQDSGYDDLREEFFASYEVCMTERTRTFHDVSELVGELVAMKLPWGVVTNKAERFALPLTRHMPLFSSAGAIVCGDTTPHAKPHPAPLLEAAARLNVAPHQCVYVGDDERDIIAGLAAGMGAVAATYGYLGQNGDVDQWGAHAQIKSPLELLNLIRDA